MISDVTETIPVFHDAAGDPLDAGYIYIGISELDPETNPKAAYWDEAATIVATQPIRTIAGRIQGQSGAVARLYVDGEYSVTVKDKNSALVYTTEAGETAAAARANLGLASNVVTKASNYTATLTDRGDAFVFSGSYTLSLDAAATLGDGWFIDVISTDGTVTVDPNGSEAINSVATFGISAGSSARVLCNGSEFFTEFTGVDEDFSALTALDDLDDVADGVYGWEASAPSNSPYTFAFASQLTLDGGTVVQVAWGGSESRVSVRRKFADVWGDWSSSIADTDAQTQAVWDAGTDTTESPISPAKMSLAATYHAGVKGVSDYTSSLTASDISGDAPAGATHADLYLCGSGASGGNVEWGGSAATLIKFNVPITQLTSVTTVIGASVEGDASVGASGNDSTYTDGTISMTAEGGRTKGDYKTQSGAGASTDHDICIFGSPEVTGYFGGLGAYGAGGFDDPGNFSGAGVLRVFWR